MKHLLIFCLSLSSLVGCTLPITAKAIKAAEYACTLHGGLRNITTDTVPMSYQGEWIAVCNNGTEVRAAYDARNE